MTNKSPSNAKKSTSSKKTSPRKRSSWCSCDVCYCGPNCQCTETLCHGEASSVLNSLAGSKANKLQQKQQQHQQQRQESKNQGSCCGGGGGGAGGNDVNDLSIPSGIDTLAPITETNNAKTKKLYGTNSAVVEILVGGMTCSMCTKSVEQALIGVDGVSNVSVSLATNTARVEYDTTMIEKSETLLDTIECIGYDATMATSSSPEDGTGLNRHRSVEFTISGMTCSMCTQAIQRALEATEGVLLVNVVLSTNTALVDYDDTFVTMEELKETIEDIGYDVVDTVIPEQQEPVSEDRLTRILQQQQEEVDNRKNAFLWSLAGTMPILLLTMIVPHIHISWLDKVLGRHIHIGRYQFILEALILWVLCTPIQFGCGWAFFKSSWYGLQLGVLGMDVLVALGTSASYGYAVWATLVGSMEYHFFETSAVLICFVLLGKWMQSLAVRRTSQALTRLLALQPKTAIRVSPPSDEQGTIEDGTWNPLDNPYQEEVVPLQAVRTGDIVKVLKGASIPADGVVAFGEMSVDESMVTGESVPILKTKGSVVLGATICAEAGQASGAAFIEVTGVGSDTALSQIVQLVQDAQSRQVPIQNLADQISAIFVPTVVTLSVITFMVWYALCQCGVVPASLIPEGESPATFSFLFGIACLVISCPCALGLATPTAVMVGTGVGARQGILMKGGETLELASRVNSVVFDKTGTLTKGKPAITDFHLTVSDELFWKRVIASSDTTNDDDNDSKKMPPFTAKEYTLWLLGSLERNSEHPLATAVVRYAEDALHGRVPFTQPTDFVALTGRGASGTIDGTIHVAAGNRGFCELQDLQIDQKVENRMQRLERQGKTAIIASINSTVCVVMGIADELKADAKSSIAYLKNEMNVDVWMVTGDNRRTARAIARQLDLPTYRVVSEALPIAKVEQVQRLQEQGKVVAMIGDGVNDSPALAQADVGLSLGTGAEIAAEASDMVLVKGDVAEVCTALDLSRFIFRRIQLNFLFSLLYNCLSIPLAAGVLYPLTRTRLPPTVAAIAMALSSISVVGSSLALKLYKPPTIVVGSGSGSGSSTTATTMTTMTTGTSTMMNSYGTNGGSSSTSNNTAPASSSSSYATLSERTTLRQNRIDDMCNKKNERERQQQEREQERRQSKGKKNSSSKNYYTTSTTTASTTTEELTEPLLQLDGTG